MKHFFTILLFTISIDLAFQYCANPQSPTGGPKDTIPPSLVYSEPSTGEINVKQTTFTLEFSEFIQADRLTQNLIITPRTKIRYKHIVKKNELIIKFEEPLADSTTYSLNFFNGITDITEKIPAVNLVLAFSTGSTIDSMQVKGKVENIFTKKPASKYTVGLYDTTDTLDFLTQSPLYFTTTSDQGDFNMAFIKPGNYKILAFDDKNGNLLLDPEEEQHGFLSDTLALYDSLPEISIPTLLQNVIPLKRINHRTIGSHYEIRFNRKINDYTIQPDTLFHNIVGENKNIIRIYNPKQFAFNDSIPIQLTAYDDLDNTVKDTIHIAFAESDRKPAPFSYSIHYKEKSLTNNPSYQITFSKPIVKQNVNKIIYQADSTFSYPPDSLLLEWNHNRTALKMTTYLKKNSLYSEYEQHLALDTLPKDPMKTSPIEFIINKGAFMSVESDTSKQTKIAHRKEFSEPHGVLKLDLVTQHNAFIVQLINNNNEVTYTSKNNKHPSFTVRPSEYSVRILIDSNEDGTWSPGNLLRNQEPEPIYLYPPKITVRENWIIEDIDIAIEHKNH